MSRAAETPLFPPEMTPVRAGVYKVRLKLYPNTPHPKVVTFWSLWDNGQWHCALPTRHSAAASRSRSFDCYRPGTLLGWIGLRRPT